MKKKVTIVIGICLLSVLAVSCVSCSPIGLLVKSLIVNEDTAGGIIERRLKKRYNKEFIVKDVERLPAGFIVDDNPTYMACAYIKDHEEEIVNVRLEVSSGEVRDDYASDLFKDDIKKKANAVLEQCDGIKKYEIVSCSSDLISNTSDYKSCEEYLAEQDFSVSLELEYKSQSEDEIIQVIQTVCSKMKENKLSSIIKFNYNGKIRHIYYERNEAVLTKENIQNELERKFGN